MGLKASEVAFHKEALAQIINGYAREAGVRSFENNIKKIMRKVAVKVASEEEMEKKEETNSRKIERSTEKNLDRVFGQTDIHNRSIL